jgi:hypothetical protein
MVGHIHVLYDGVQGVRGQVFIYLNAKSIEQAEKAIELANEKAKTPSKALHGENERHMNISLAKMVVAPCKIDEQNNQYENPVKEVPCTCPTCRANLRPPRPSPCNCSGCQPKKATTSEGELDVVMSDTAEAVSIGETGEKKVKVERISTKMHEHGTEAFTKLQISWWRRADIASTHMNPPDIYFLDDDIKRVLNHFYKISSAEMLDSIIMSSEVHVHTFDIYSTITSLREEFAAMKERTRLEWNAKVKAA